MQDREVIEIMQRCKEEILSLRRTIDKLTPKADAYDQMSKVLNLLPERSQGYGEDLAWRLQRRIEDLEAQLTKPEPAQDGFAGDDAGGGP